MMQAPDDAAVSDSDPRLVGFAAAARALYAELVGGDAGDRSGDHPSGGRIALAIAWRVRALRALAAKLVRRVRRLASSATALLRGRPGAGVARAPGWSDTPASATPWRGADARQPLVSVIIPTCGRAHDLARALAAWARQRPAELPFELVVVDDGSRDTTPELLAAWHTDRYSLRTARQENRGPAAARNRALELARAPLVLFTGDDIEPTPELLAEHLRAHAARGDGTTAVLGRIEWPAGIALTATMRHVDGYGAQQFSFRHMADGAEYDFRHFYTSNVSLPRALLDLAPGGFSTAYPAAAFEDADLAWRLVPHGLHIVYRRSALAFHHHHYDAAGFFARQVRCGRMAWVLYQRFPELAGHLSIAALERLRAVAGAADRVPDAPVDALERHMLAVAAAADELPDAVADPLLLAVFRYGFLRGLAAAASDPDGADQVAREALRELLLPALAAATAAADRLAGPQ